MKKNILAQAMLLMALSFVGYQPLHANDGRMFTFPESNELFHRLLADPRQGQTSVNYYRLNHANMADIALGNTWGMHRWNIAKDGRTLIQWDVEGMAYTRFRISGTINEFQTIDFFGNIPVEIRRGIGSARLTLFHESSHLGDDYFRTTGNPGFRYSNEGLRAIFSVEPDHVVRFYGGASYLLHSIPHLKEWTLQTGMELKTADLKWWVTHPCSLYLAQDFQSKEENKWNINSNTEIGLRVGFVDVIRSLRVYLAHFDGHSPFGQFYTREESFSSIGIGFDF